MLSEVITFLLDAYQEALDLLPNISEWLESLVTWNAVVWYALGLVTLGLSGRIRIRYGFWRIKSRIARRVNGQSDCLIPSATRTFSKACPKAPIRMGKEEVTNVTDILSKIVEIGGENPTTDWKQLWSQVDAGWLDRFFSKGRIIREPLLQDALAKAFMYESTKPGRFDHRDIDILAAISVENWKIFTDICSFACCIDGRITPIVLNYEDAVYERAGLSVEILAGLIAAGLITQGGTGDIYTLKMPMQGLRVRYFNEDDFVVRPLLAPIPRKFLGTTRTQPDPLDKSINVGVVDFTRVGRVLGFLTSCSKVDGFTEYLRCQWEVYLHNQEINS